MERRATTFLVIAFLVAIYSLVASTNGWWPFGNSSQSEAVLSQSAGEEDSTVCGEARVIAENLETGDVGSFPNDCEVPDGWGVIGEEEDELFAVGSEGNPDQSLPRESGGGFLRSETGQVIGVVAESPRTGGGLSLSLFLAGFTTFGFMFNKIRVKKKWTQTEKSHI